MPDLWHSELFTHLFCHDFEIHLRRVILAILRWRCAKNVMNKISSCLFLKESVFQQNSKQGKKQLRDTNICELPKCA